MHKLLAKQLTKALDAQTGDPDIVRLLEDISHTYDNYDRMRDIESRAMQLMSDELNAANEAILRESDAMISQSQRRFEIAVSGTQDGIWDWNVRENTLWFSRRALSMLGYREQDFLSPTIENWLSLIDPEDIQAARQFLAACHKGDAHPVITLRMRDRAGRVRHILCRAQGILDSMDKAARVVGVHTDLTDLIAMQEELKKSRDKAEAANKAKSEFLANMTHELRTPLNSIITLSRLASDTHDDAERKKFMDVVTGSSELLLAIVSDILDFSKIEANEMKLETIGFDIVSAIGKALVPVRHLAAEKDLGFNITFDCHGTIPFMCGDPFRLGQIITNLATNAIKYTETGSVNITVKIEVDDIDNSAGIEIDVQDTGIGISSESQKTIFEKFSQADTSTTRRYGGTGLGLAISNRIVSLMGGKLLLDSTLGKGSTFKVILRLPLAEALQGDGLSITQSLPPVGSDAPTAAEARILVVEDHPMNQLVMEKVLQKFGFRRIIMAENGAVALRILEVEAFDIVLMDCFMPVMDGYEATEKIRKAEEGTDNRMPIVALTANASAADKERCIKAGMDHYTVKPLAERELLRILGAYIKLPDHILPACDTVLPSALTSLNLSLLCGYSHGDIVTENMLVDAFIKQSRINLANLEEALAKSDADGWLRAAHTLKGGARSIGAELLGELASKAQSEGLDGVPDGTTLLRNIKSEFLKVSDLLYAYLKKAA